MQLLLCGGKKLKYICIFGGNKYRLLPSVRVPEKQSGSRIKFPLKSACEMSHICKSGSFYGTLVDEGAHRRTHGGARRRTDPTGHTNPRTDWKAVLPSALCLLRFLSGGLPVCRSSHCLTSPSEPLSLKDGAMCYAFHAFSLSFFFF